MGIESDHLVYEYLSRVGDLAQRRQLSSGDRMRLVSGLRDEIDRRRARYEPETPAAVRRILERIGTPEEVVGTMSAAGPPDPGQAPPAVPVQRGAAPPHLAGLDELGKGEVMEPDWWRVAPESSVEGFAGGIEIPELFKRPATKEPAGDADADADQQDGPGGPEAPAGPPTLLRFLKERRRARAEAKAEAKAADEAAGKAPAGPRPKPHAFLLLAAVALVAGAVSGQWLLLAGGWLLAYASRVLGPAERKWVVFGLPGAVFAAAVVWLWGRQDGRWGRGRGGGVTAPG
ncbi:hypothetical protein [Streptomyces sp. ICC4]|uniref:hypothetical protein n=1 Tax=Streptomyces sp. ICC4 TaxID=2099584 RepID=UPI000DC7819A|nr:hypothetical protein [Streptomyces sp. ICC4]AWZ09361.1 hypothetical protein DRB89_38335 [Streptomyces sp. ICC4]